MSRNCSQGQRLSRSEYLAYVKEATANAVCAVCQLPGTRNPNKPRRGRHTGKYGPAHMTPPVPNAHRIQFMGCDFTLSRVPEDPNMRTRECVDSAMASCKLIVHLRCLHKTEAAPVSPLSRKFAAIKAQREEREMRDPSTPRRAECSRCAFPVVQTDLLFGKCSMCRRFIAKICVETPSECPDN
jgi:hypothetical protein